MNWRLLASVRIRAFVETMLVASQKKKKLEHIKCVEQMRGNDDRVGQ